MHQKNESLETSIGANLLQLMSKDALLKGNPTAVKKAPADQLAAA
jgi:hypothetical protein